MPQFAVCRNPNPASRSAFPLLLDVQSDLTDPLGTRVVVPLATLSSLKGMAITTLTPVFEIAGKRYLMLTPQLAGVPKRLIGAQVASLARERDTILAALDLLFTGI